MTQKPRLPRDQRGGQAHRATERYRGTIFCGAVAILWFCGVSGSLTTTEAAEVRLKSVTVDHPIVEVFGRCELTIEIEGTVENPYDPDVLTVEASFEPARGRPITVPAFYYQPFERAIEKGQTGILRPVGKPIWKVRFTPRSPGLWAYDVTLTTPRGSQVSARKTVEVVPSTRRGFVQLNPDTGMFRFDRKQPFVPIGENLCWGPTTQPLAAYEQWFQALAKQRANYIRLWMAPWFLRLETSETGVGRYDQARAWQMDYLMEQSEKAGLYWQLCLLDHGSFSRSQDPEWQTNPYNDQLGGMCRLPDDFVVDPRAKAKFKQLLRYLVSRWGYSPQLVSWELFNEPDLSEIKLEHLTPWVAEMSQYLRTLDPNHHPMTISFHHEAAEAVWRLPTIDWIQLHVYDQREFASLFCGLKIPQLQETFRKPVMVGEFGWIEEFIRKVDNEGIHLHDGMWSSLMAGAAGGALPWYWDTYVHPNRLERHFRPVALFWRGEQFERRMRRLELSLSDTGLLGCGVGTPERAYLWIKNRSHSVDEYLAYRCELAKQRLLEERGEPTQHVTYPPRVVQGATATVSGLGGGGRYRIEWWDPYRGRVMGSAVGAVQGGRLTVQVPELAFDVAAKLIRLPWWERG